MKYIYTKPEAVNEIMDMYKRHIKSSRLRINRCIAGEISSRSKDELEARDEKDMRKLIESFVMVG
jgi:ribosomal protein L31E